jgi:hypothetical protein
MRTMVEYTSFDGQGPRPIQTSISAALQLQSYENPTQAILTSCAYVSDIGFCFLKFGLSELDDKTQAKVVPGLSQTES